MFPGARVDEGRPLLGVAWAANRVWMIAPQGKVATLASARVSGRALAGFATARVPGGSEQYVPIVGGELILAGDDGTFIESLLPNGRLGPPERVPDLLAPAKQAVPKLETLAIQAGLRAGARRIWALSGSPPCHSSNGCPGYFLVCCSESGAATDLTRFVDDRRIGAHLPELGLDARGRLWLAWLDRSRTAIRGRPRVLRLDAASLVPRTGAVAPPALVADRVQLACAASCHIAAQSAAGDIVSWAPGERAPTRMVRNVVSRNGVYRFPRELLATAYRGAGLVVAYRGPDGEERPGGGDRSRPRRRTRRPARVVARVATAYGWPPGKLIPPYSDPVAYGMFVPGGLLALEHFRYGGASPLVYAFVRVAR